MSDDESDSTFVRFVMPFVLIAVGLITLGLTPGTNMLSVAIVHTVGFGLFATGVFSFALIYNHARNPLATDKVVVNSAQALVVYGGLLAALLYEQILTLGSVVVAVSLVFLIGMAASAVVEISVGNAETA